MASETRRLSLVVPGLLGPATLKHTPEMWRSLTAPALEELLSRATRTATEHKGLERTLFALFKVAISPEGDLPVAALTRQWDTQDAGDVWWLRADPVHLSADRDRLVMMGNTMLSITSGECQTLAAELNEHFKGDSFELSAANANRWYLRLDGDPRIRTEMLFDVIGQDVLHHMPYGPDESRWRVLMNEVQMVLHASTVNHEREARGETTVNSLWFWGGGHLPRMERSDWSQVWGNDDLSQSLASLAGIPCATLPEDAMQWLDAGDGGDHLMVFDGLREKVQFGNVEAWRELIDSLHEYWLAPLLGALKRRHIAALEILPAGDTVFRITGRDARRWWMRRRPLMEWLGA